MDEGRGVDRLCPIRQATTNPEVDRYGCGHVVFVCIIIIIIIFILLYDYIYIDRIESINQVATRNLISIVGDITRRYIQMHATTYVYDLPDQNIFCVKKTRHSTIAPLSTWKACQDIYIIKCSYVHP